MNLDVQEMCCFLAVSEVFLRELFHPISPIDTWLSGAVLEAQRIKHNSN